MARRTSALRDWPKMPFLMADRSDYISKAIVIVAREINMWWGLYRSTASNEVVARALPDSECSLGRDKAQYYFLSNEMQGMDKRVNIAKTHLENLRLHALQEGASPEAIRLLNSVRPFTQKEISEMTEKLARKKAPPAKEAKPAKAAKASKGEAPKRKGNPEALAKAREARAANATPDTRKITILKKENPYRAESGRAAQFELVKKSKTVQDFKEAGGKIKYVPRWVDEGLISLK